ncbi:putative major facilitator, sugar transporter, major facilitator superfamily [Medicago truncatula]|uniref:Putative major facilitator, sugar transporter, major facilitator superfamily n=1 Tax=Medicago truncatula TaxID=3880 RepID=A0A396J896_MEDTR|nr:putative major facilitator, sugar transporter, major facilitator superfamily [Medicago truncatula]
MQETIVSMASAGAIIGAAFGGYMNDKMGRKKTILMADVVFVAGALVMAAAPAPWVIIIGRLLVGLGVGAASMTAPLYISEASPAKIRGALAPGTWRWMLGVAAIPAIIQFVLMLSLPESPRWLYRQEEEAKQILSKIYRPGEVEEEMKAMHESIEAEKAEDGLIGHSLAQKLKGAWSNDVVRRGLYAGITVQVVQQIVGINTIMYYSPTIVQFAGIASNSTAFALSLVTSGLNAVGTIVSMVLIDRFGRRKLMLISLIGIFVSLVTLSVTFNQAAHHAPSLSIQDSLSFGGNSTCKAYTTAPNHLSWNCMQCLHEDCAFCANSQNEFLPGACLAAEKNIRGMCCAQNCVWFSQGCPSRIGILAVVILGLYIISYAPGIGTVPWVLNSEIYPLRFRGIGGGIAAVFNWCANVIMSESFLSMIKTLGTTGTFLTFAGFSLIGFVAIYLLVPETKGLQFEEVEKLLQKGFRPFPFNKKKDDDKGKEEVKHIA